MSGIFDRLGQELEAREKAAGLSLADVLTLPDDQRRLFNWMLRQEEVSLEQVIAYLNQGEPAARDLLAELVGKFFVREIKNGDESRYRVRLAPKRGREVPLNIWQALSEKTVNEEGGR